MNSAEFDTWTRGLGLSVGELAEVCDFPMVTVQHWLTSAEPVPAEAVGAVQGLEDAMEHAIEEMTALHAELVERHGEASVVLYRYRSRYALIRSTWQGSQLPLGAHAMLISWAADELASQGVDVEIAWGDPLEGEA